MEVWIGGRCIETTSEHPFFVVGRAVQQSGEENLTGWLPAAWLRAGDLLLSHAGQLLEVEAVADPGRVLTVYNLEVEDAHTYFVGGSDWGFSVWAHNSYDGNRTEQLAQQHEMAQELMKRGVSESNAKYLAKYIRQSDIDGTALLQRVRASEVPENLNAEALRNQPDMRKGGMHGDIDFVPVGGGERMVIRIGSNQGGDQLPHVQAQEQAMAATGEFLFITRDRSLARATGVPDLLNYPTRAPGLGGETAGSLRPDLTGLRYDGGIRVVDVASPSQITGTPRQTFDNNIRLMRLGLNSSTLTQDRTPIVNPVYPSYP